MSDLIERQDAIDSFLTIGSSFVYGDDVCKAIVSRLKQLPSAERTGHWINGKCDQCGGHAPFWAMASTYYQSNFCPNCGARMVQPDEDEPETDWIPVSERLPEIDGKYLVTNTRGSMEVDWNEWLNGEWFYPNTKPIAWMPLPKPYKEEKHE